MKTRNRFGTPAAAVVAALVLVAPFASLPASASTRALVRSSVTVRGTVVATNAARHTLVVSTGRALDTVRFATARAAERTSLGVRVRVAAIKLADGTFRALTVRTTGRARAAVVRGTVVSSSARELLVSGGGSVVAIASVGRHAHTSGSSPVVGAVVDVGVSIHPTGLDETSLDQTGTSSFIGLEGTLSSLSSTSLVIAVEDGALTTVQIPASITLPTTIKAGDQVELQVAYANQVFTLVTIIDDTLAANQTGQGVTQNQGNDSAIEAEGTVVSSSSTSLTIQPGDGAAAITYAVPSTFAGSVPSAGLRVDATGTLVNGVLTLQSVVVQQPEGEQGNGSPTTQVEGLVMAVTAPTATAAGSLTVQPGDQAAPVILSIPAGFNFPVVSTNDRVHVTGSFVGGLLTLVSVRVQQPEGDQGNGQQSTSLQTDGTVVSYVAGVNGADGQLVVQPSDQAGLITIDVPSSVDVSNVTVGDHVQFVATLQNNALTLVSISLND